MKSSVLRSNNFSPYHFAHLLQKCLKLKALGLGKQTHAILLTSGTNLNALSLHAKLVGMYASCGDLKSANYLFRRIQKPNIFALNWMVFSFTVGGCYQEAMGYISLMRDFVTLFNEFTFSVVLKACVGLADLRKAKEVHCLVNAMGFMSEVRVANALIDVYCKCGHLGHAREVFDKMPVRDVASWTSMICGYCNAGKIEHGISLFERMKFERIQPNEFTWNAVICGCARCGDSTRAFEFFGRMIREEGLVPDLVTWNAMISGFSQSQQTDMALKIFSDMLASGVRPNEVTLTGLLPSCGMMGSIHRGRGIHGLVYRMGLKINPFVATALIDMYSKCGSVKNARAVFDSSPAKNIASWNAMIGCYGRHGLVNSVLELFEMIKDEMVIQPNESTFVSVLSACSHGGEVEKGLQIFASMRESYKTEAQREHYACVVDMLCRAGKMEEAYEFLKEIISVENSDSMIGAFFNGCKMHGRKDLAEMCVKEILEMDLKRPGGFVTLSNIYAVCGEWNEVSNVREMMKEKDATKKPGFSWVEGSECCTAVRNWQK